jgi:hypothetical protein
MGRGDNLKLRWVALLSVCVLGLAAAAPVLAWSNGGYSNDPAHPDYGTHDWIAQHALDYLPTQEKQYLTDNLQVYLYGTELPDNNQAADGIGDTTKHHIYFDSDGALQDDAAAKRASDEYQKALSFLKAQDYAEAAKEAGIMTHYIADVAVFGHVMGTKTDWGAEIHHQDYEDHVLDNTETYTSSFEVYLHFDGNLTILSAYDAAENLAYDTTFGGTSGYGCTWMDNNYNWSNAAFSGRCSASLNLAVNAVADVLHTLYVEASPAEATPTIVPTAASTPAPTPTAPEFSTLLTASAIMLIVIAMAIVQKIKLKRAA